MNPKDIETLVEEEVRTEIFQPAINAAPNMKTSQSSHVFVEIGTYVGGNICRVGQMIKKSKKNIVLIGVDDFGFENISTKALQESHLTKGSSSAKRKEFYSICENNVIKCGLKKYIQLTVGDSIEVSKSFDDESIDLIFLDGAHDEGYVRKELGIWIPKVKNGGIISGHDYPSGGIKRAVEQHLKDKKINVTSTKGAYWCIK